jgi:hypothetical protein
MRQRPTSQRADAALLGHTSLTQGSAAPACDDIDDAIAAYGVIEVAWRHVPPSHDFDATVVARGETGGTSESCAGTTSRRDTAQLTGLAAR